MRFWTRIEGMLQCFVQSTKNATVIFSSSAIQNRSLFGEMAAIKFQVYRAYLCVSTLNSICVESSSQHVTHNYFDAVAGELKRKLCHFINLLGMFISRMEPHFIVTR